MTFFRTFIGATFLATAATAQVTPDGCLVEALTGTAETVRGDTRTPLAVTSIVARNDRIETGQGGALTLVCPDDLRISVGPGSVVELVDLDQNTGGWAAALSIGIARFARPVFGGARFEVRTPSAVASVRSTVWVVEVEDTNATSVFVSEGIVDVSGAAMETAALSAGDGITVSPDGASTGLSQWSPGRIRALDARLAPQAE